MSSDSTHFSRFLRDQLPGVLIRGAVVSLVLLGLVILYSAGRGENGSILVYAKKQATWAFFGYLVYWVVNRLNLENLREFVWPIGIVTYIVLILVLIPGIGVKVNGARRWIDLGPMNMQVSDFAKIGLVFVLAHYLAVVQRAKGCPLKTFVIPCLALGPLCALILLQPDYGTTALVGTVAGIMLFLAGLKYRYLIPSVLVCAITFCVMVYYNPVRLKRVVSFLDVEAHKADGSYQLWQSLLAFGSGGIHGAGLGNGRQQMDRLPEAHTDFVFSIIGEELGLLYVLLVVFAFLLIFVATMLRVGSAPNVFQYLLVVGSMLMIVLQALINFGVVTGCLPTKGMSLPFISYGGSNLVSMFIFTGFIINCFRSWSKQPGMLGKDIRG